MLEIQPPAFEIQNPDLELTPRFYHLECGWKALLLEHGQLSFWRRWSNNSFTYVPIDSPLGK